MFFLESHKLTSMKKVRKLLAKVIKMNEQSLLVKILKAFYGFVLLTLRNIQKCT